MCTLILASQLYADAPLLVGGNRDEQVARPAGPPVLWSDREIPVLAPVDRQAGGTWLGLNAAGVFAGLTNRFGRPPDPGRASRGEIVLEALREADVPSAIERVRALGAMNYNPFHLVVANRDEAAILWTDGWTMHPVSVQPGWVVLSERSFGAAPTAREEWLQRQLPQLSLQDVPGGSEWRTLLSHHAVPTMEGTCVHHDAANYGTRSAMWLRLGRQSADVDFQYMVGPPCTSEVLDMRAPAEALLRDWAQGGESARASADTSQK